MCYYDLFAVTDEVQRRCDGEIWSPFGPSGDFYGHVKRFSTSSKQLVKQTIFNNPDIVFHLSYYMLLFDNVYSSSQLKQSIPNLSAEICKISGTY